MPAEILCNKLKMKMAKPYAVAANHSGNYLAYNLVFHSILSQPSLTVLFGLGICVFKNAIDVILNLKMCRGGMSH